MNFNFNRLHKISIVTRVSGSRILTVMGRAKRIVRVYLEFYFVWVLELALTLALEVGAKIVSL